jgi:hypothetical protein
MMKNKSEVQLLPTCSNKPKPVVLILARALGVTPLFEDCGEFRVGDIHACVADLSQTLDKLNYKPTVSLEEGMRKFASWANDKRSIDQYQKTVDELKAFGLFGRSQLSDKP